MLSRNDWRAFARVCRAWFDIVFEMTRVAVFVVDDTSTEQMLQASTWLLGRAAEVRWSSVSSPGWKGVPNLSSSSQAPRINTFKIMLPLLSGCRNLTSLVLTGIVVSGEHQHAIYCLPHLRKISLRSARFQNTAIKMPKHNVTQLRFFNVLSEVALSHILRQTSSILTTLWVSEGPTKAFSLDTPRCPRLTTFTHRSTRRVNKEVITFLERHPNIRVLRLNEGCTLQDLGPSLLPKLTKVTARWKLSPFFLANPELTEFYQQPNDLSVSVSELVSSLAQAQRSQRHPPRLHQLRVAILHNSYSWGALPVISQVFGSSLCKLHIWIEECSRDRLGHKYSYLLGDWSRLKGPGDYHRSQVTMAFVHLRFIRVSFGLKKGVKFPETICKRLLKDRILPLCPVLEEALFTIVPSYGTIEREGHEDGMELRIRKKGRKWDLLQN